jgi:hypothetical protein
MNKGVRKKREQRKRESGSPLKGFSPQPMSCVRYGFLPTISGENKS